MSRAKPQEREKAAQMLRAGKRTVEIQKALGVSQPFVIEVKKSIGLWEPRKPKEMLTLKCDHCGKNFKRPKNIQTCSDNTRKRRGRRQVGHYCNRKCWLASVQWSPEDLQTIRDNFGTKTNREISELVGRGECQVGEMAHRMGLRYFDIHTTGAPNCKWCGVARADEAVSFCRDYCNRCYNLLADFDFNEEIAETHELLSELRVAVGRKRGNKTNKRKLR